jgi:hypothetical protein
MIPVPEDGAIKVPAMFAWSPLTRKRLDCGLHRARAENDKSTEKAT